MAECEHCACVQVSEPCCDCGYSPADELETLRGIARRLREPDIEVLAEAVHRAYLDTCERFGWSLMPENQVPYADLSDDSKELDRASVRAVLAEVQAIYGTEEQSDDD